MKQTDCFLLDGYIVCVYWTLWYCTYCLSKAIYRLCIPSVFYCTDCIPFLLYRMNIQFILDWLCVFELHWTDCTYLTYILDRLYIPDLYTGQTVHTWSIYWTDCTNRILLVDITYRLCVGVPSSRDVHIHIVHHTLQNGHGVTIHKHLQPNQNPDIKDSSFEWCSDLSLILWYFALLFWTPETIILLSLEVCFHCSE